jgi:6-phosphogluconolactonase
MPLSARSPTLPFLCWIGTYTGGGGAGLYPLLEVEDRLAIGAADDAAANASFGAYSLRFDVHYLVDERDDGALGMYRHDATGWSTLDRVTAAGAAPCHVALDDTQSWIAIANYASGSIALYRLGLDGMPITPPFVHANRGSGPVRERQRSPHAHWVGFGCANRLLYATDLGTDEVLAFAFDVERGILGLPHTAFVAPPGSGPRHMLFHPRHARTAYLACELTSTLMVLDVDESGGLHERTTLSSLPASWQGTNIVAHIDANVAGDRLYVSNRGHDSITVYALDDQGDATPIQHVASGGASPRFLKLIDDGRRMIVAHERDHRVAILAILPDGTLSATERSINIPGAAFVFAA